MTGKIAGILGKIDDLAEQESRVSVGDVMEHLGHRSTGVFLLIPGLIGMSPIGGIPSIPTLMAAIVLILSCQIAFGRASLWLPGFLRNRSVDDDRLSGAADKAGGVARWLDRWFGNRLTWAASDMADRIACGLCAVLALMIPPFELVPFAATAPLGAITLFGLALILKDGVLMLAGFACAIAAIYVAWTVMPF